VKAIAEQFEIDFAKLEGERELFERWEANRAADAENWTEEAMAMVWYLGQSDWETWRQLPNYEREHVLVNYRLEQTLATALGHHRIKSYREACPGVCKEKLKTMRAVAEEMANQLSADWSAQRPPSVFTYDPVIAGMISVRLGRRVEAIKRENQMWEVYP
jgi:hypothetical protein